jgi:DHA1 family tetracycline resistance protein-like MFS transporter
MVVLFRILHGAMTANLGTAQACIADTTTPENRAKGMGLFGASFGIGFTLGPLIGGELSQLPHWLAERGWLEAVLPLLGGNVARAKLAFPMAFAGLLSVLNLVLALRYLPETRHAGSVTSKRSIHPRALWTAVSHPVIGLCILLSFVQVFSFSAMESCFTLFAKNQWRFEPQDIGRYFGLVGILGIVIQGGLIGPLVKRFGEARLVPLGLGALAIGLGAVPFTSVAPGVDPGWRLVLDFTVLAVGQGLATPTLQGLISRSAGAHEQGTVLGSAQSMSALARALGPAFGGMLFTRVGEGAPFLTSAALLVGAVALSFPATARAVAAMKARQGAAS